MFKLKDPVMMVDGTVPVPTNRYAMHKVTVYKMYVQNVLLFKCYERYIYSAARSQVALCTLYSMLGCVQAHMLS